MNTCPNCEKDIEESVDICPHCNEPIDFYSLEDKRRKFLAILCIILILLIAMPFLSISIFYF